MCVHDSHGKQQIPMRCKDHGTSITTVLLGDSNTSNMPVDIFPEAYTNCGTPGRTSGMLLRDIPRVLEQYRPESVYLMVGTNDVFQSVTPDQFADNIHAIITELRQQGIKVYVRSILPTNGHWAWANQIIKNYTVLARRITLECGETYLDTRSEFENGEGKLRSEYTSDGIHLNEKGMAVMKQHFLENSDVLQ